MLFKSGIYRFSGTEPFVRSQRSLKPLPDLFLQCGMHIGTLFIAESWNLSIFAEGGQQQRANAGNELWKATWLVSGMTNKDLNTSVTRSFGCYFTSTFAWNVVISIAHVLAG